MRVIGTAGHVDHGKSTLVRALTGTDPDRLREEKERGMTIDLGFARLTLPSGDEASIVDVPGHERFIRNMLAGVTGIDAALLVVAADESVMPQTREHVAILDLLGVAACVVALTKADLVTPEWLALVETDVRELLDGTVLEGAPFVQCSATTGYGVDHLTAELDRVLAGGRRRSSAGPARLPIDRVFTVSGFGTVVTGTLVDGQLRLGQELEVQPGALRTRVRGLQTHNDAAERVSAGSRVAVNLTRVNVDQLVRGQVLSEPGRVQPTQALDVRVRVARESAPVKHNAVVTFHSGAAETLGRVILLEADQLGAGQEGWAQLRLTEPVAVTARDGFILRVPSPSATVAGGTVVDAHARRHRRRNSAVLHQLEVLARGNPDQVLLEHLTGHRPSEVKALVDASGLDPRGALASLQALVERGQVVALSGADGTGRMLDGHSLVIGAKDWTRLCARVEDLLRHYHAAFPLRVGLRREELRARLAQDPRVFARMLGRLGSLLAEDGAFVRLADHAVRFDPGDDKRIVLLRGLLRQAGVSPPERASWEATLGLSSEVTDALISRGDLVEVAPGLVYDRETLEALVKRIRAAIEREGPRTVAQLRDELRASRRFILALVTYTDEHKLTRRLGDQRVLY